MADRSSVDLFSRFFELLAENPTDEHKNIAEKLYIMTNGYDFCLQQMECNESLIKLGLATIQIDDDGDNEIIYKEIE